MQHLVEDVFSVDVPQQGGVFRIDSKQAKVATFILKKRVSRSNAVAHLYVFGQQLKCVEEDVAGFENRRYMLDQLLLLVFLRDLEKYRVSPNVSFECYK